MTRQKISATIDPRRLDEARRMTGTTNVSALLNAALDALVDRERERMWLEAHPDQDLPGEVPVDLREVPWDED